MKKSFAFTSIFVLLLQVLSASASPQETKNKSFFEWCQQRDSLPESIKNTVDVLLKKSGTTNCEIASSWLASINSLDLKRNQIINIEPLTGLVDLTDLNLFDNQISDAKPLSTLTNLTKLNINSNKINSTQFLINLTKLNSLDLRYNQIEGNYLG
jgi:internalin A